jgi:outer membrane receptor for ferrienterochelin and colicins
VELRLASAVDHAVRVHRSARAWDPAFGGATPRQASPRVPARAIALAILAASTLTLLLPNASAAQQPPGTVVVHVTSDSTPVADATVQSGTRRATTDSVGIASLDLPAGHQQLAITKIGFAPVTVQVIVVSGRRTAVNVALREAVTELSAVVVSATRDERRIADEPTRVEVTDQDDVEEQLTSSPGNIAELLTEASGVRVQTTSSGLGGASVRIRGLPGRYTEILSDGLPLFGLSTEGLSPLQIPPVDLQRVEVIKGVASALYGPTALGGVVDLISQPPDNSSRLLLNQTSRDAEDAVLWDARQWNPAWGYTLVASAHRQDAEDMDHDGWFDFPGYRRVVLRPRLYWTGSQGNSLFLTTGLMAEGRSGGTLPGAVLPSGQPLALLADSWRGDAGGVGRFRLGSGLHVSVRGSTTEQWRTQRFGATQERDRRNTLFSEVALTLDRGAHVLVLGSDVERDAYTALDLPAMTYTYTSPGVFLQDTWTPADWFGATASARLDAHSRYGTFVSPRLSLLVHQGDRWNLRLAAGTGVFTPTPFTAETEAIGLSHLRPITGLVAERARGLSADLGTALGAVELDGSVFATAVDHPVELAAVSGSSTDVQLVNAAAPTRTEGAELFARYEREPLTVTAMYQYLQGTQLDVATGLRGEVPLDPRHAGGLTIVWADEDEGTRFGLEGYYTGPQALADDPYRTTSRPYLTIDALVEVPVGPAVLFLHGEDLTDVHQSQFEPLLRPTPGLGGAWTPDVWAPLAGRVINAGISTKL